MQSKCVQHSRTCATSPVFHSRFLGSALGYTMATCPPIESTLNRNLCQTFLKWRGTVSCFLFLCFVFTWGRGAIDCGVYSSEKTIPYLALSFSVVFSFIFSGSPTQFLYPKECQYIAFLFSEKQ
ncbi:hypothetical protein BC939DRAFT_452525 [Gamsiella multidivaricata]|uniref:uncharacterized protein n=1 Tax=Gamsiella multidivaricata TaxID=101098 RepID=UPI0022210DF7|nr:uncharacterized protein BC939DRAFT_452525 [Gamsiella multidivaricata]KAI7823014.1 hypothetical protein BC939DRAFT_452525 [Gamsiella multidivaricata]